MRTSVAITNSSVTRRLAPSKPIGRMAEAEAIFAILSQLDYEGLPREEKLAVVKAQSDAIDLWLAEYAKAGESRP